MKAFSLFCILALLGLDLTARADAFFTVDQVMFHQQAAPGEPPVVVQVPKLDEAGNPVLDANHNPVTQPAPVPFVSVNVSVKAQIRSDSTMAKAYFYDDNRQLLATDDAPAVTDTDPSVFITPDKKEALCFIVPKSVLAVENWAAVVVFGDDKGVDAQVYSTGNQVSDYDFPEKSLLEDKNGPPIERKTAMDPLVEHQVTTDNPAQPQITLFMRPPLGMTDASQAKGVLCLSLLAGSLDGIKRQLQGFEGGDDVQGILKFAQDHQLIIICWGSRGLWDPRKNWDDLDPDTAWNTDKAFDQVAKAWEQGVQYFFKEYGIPANGYLLWGMSGSAQYACRLALRKPDYFLAVDIHIPSSFDKPTPDGRKILWCLTTGELEPGYQRSLRFYHQCRALGYPMVYKAIVGLGHAGSPIADQIGERFFEYALTVRDKRTAYDASLNDPLVQFQLSQTTSQIEPWLDSFKTPPFVGDAVNQGIFPYGQRDMVPIGFRVPLPTKDIADVWNQ